MALDREIARLSRILVDTQGINFDEAQARLRALKLEIIVAPDATSIAGFLAGIYFELNDLKNASEYFRRTTELSPKSELASVGLFHSLWGQGFKQEAVDEMRRFLALADSAEYSQLLHDLAVEGKLVPSMDTAQAV